MTAQVERITPIGQDPVLDMMVKQGLPLTETVYLEMQFPQGIPDQVPPELTAAMPPEVKGKKVGATLSDGMSMPDTGLAERVSQKHGVTPERAEELLKAFGA
jgi:hypothetical protein